MATRSRLIRSIAVTLALGATSLVAQRLSALPPPPEQVSANCVSPTYASDQLICASPGLLRLDRQMVEALKFAGDAALVPLSPFVESQSAWLGRRSLCAMRRGHAACLNAAYKERIAVLTGLVDGNDGSGTDFDCTSKQSPEKTKLHLRADGTAVLSRHARIVAVGLINYDAKMWTPFVTVRTNGRAARVSVAGVEQFRCRPAVISK